MPNIPNKHTIHYAVRAFGVDGEIADHRAYVLHFVYARYAVGARSDIDKVGGMRVHVKRCTGIDNEVKVFGC